MQTRVTQKEKENSALGTQGQISQKMPQQRARSQGSVATLLNLQRTHGNSFVQGFLRARRIQAKLRVSEPDDEFEREADRVAEQVLNTETSAPLRQAPTPWQPLSIQRACADCEDELKGGVWRAPLAISTQTAGHDAATAYADPAQESVNSALQGGGRPLSKSVRDFFEPRFGREFDQVRIHTDERAANSARALSARAYTLGHDIVFGAGEFCPDTHEGKRLLAHELAHVVQQRSGRQIQRLAVNPIGTGTRGTCGGYARRWDFQLSAAAPSDGYIVQKISFFESTAPCSAGEVNQSPATPKLTFWEAWPVSAGARLFSSRAAIGYTDQSTYPSSPGTSGTVVAAGEIKFFSRSTTGNIGGLSTAGTDPDWGPGREPQSGILPSTHTEPAWWTGTPIEGPASRDVTTWWNCCGPASSQTNNIFFNP